jgi:hypothetical protein
MGQKLVCFVGHSGARDLVKTSRKRCMKQGGFGRLWGAMGCISFSGTLVLSVVAKWGVLPVVVGWREVPAVSSATSRVC